MIPVENGMHENYTIIYRHCLDYYTALGAMAYPPPSDPECRWVGAECTLQIEHTRSKVHLNDS